MTGKHRKKRANPLLRSRLKLAYPQFLRASISSISIFRVCSTNNRFGSCGRCGDPLKPGSRLTSLRTIRPEVLLIDGMACPLFDNLENRDLASGLAYGRVQEKFSTAI